MSFFYNVAKAAPKPAKKVSTKDMPIHLMEEMGCKVCPRAAAKEHTYLEPEGAREPVVYILNTAPTSSDVERGRWMTDRASRAIERLLPRWADKFIRYGATTLCASDTVDYASNKQAMACCRSLTVHDIEEAQPLVVVTVGDAPLAWATHLDSYAPKFRGRLITARFGKHVCWVYPILYPNWALKTDKRKGPSLHEATMEHDLRRLFEMIDREELPRPTFYDSSVKFDSGIECISGAERGDIDRLAAALERVARYPRQALDIETNGLRPCRIKSPLLYSAAVGTFEDTVAFSLDYEDGWPTERLKRQAWELFIKYLTDSGRKATHHLGMELEWLADRIDPRVTRLTEWDDTFALAHTIDEREGALSLDVLCLMHFGIHLKEFSNLDVTRLPEYPMQRRLIYNGLDTKWTDRLRDHLMPIVEADPKLKWAYERKVRLAPTLVLTEQRGMPADIEFANKLSTRLLTELEEVGRRISACEEVKRYERKYGRFEPTNADQVLVLMDVVCDRDEVRKKGSDGVVKKTTEEEALAAIPRDEVPSAHLILEHRGIAKLESTYVRPVVEGKIVSADGLIHAKYSSVRAETGRLAAEDPNLQNWPKRKHKEIRGIVAARRRRWVLSADYGQIEFRVAGMCSEDENLVRACWTGYDVHQFWAERAVALYPPIKDWIVEEFQVDWDEKGPKTLRSETKNRWVFPSIFGAQVRSRAANMHIPEDIAERLDREFWDRDLGGFPGVKKWQERTVRFYEKHHYVETLAGIRRHGPLTLNQIINMPIQGTAAEIITEGMNAISELALIEDDMENLHPILNVHDDLSYEPFDDQLEDSMLVIAKEMCRHRFDYINVPLIIEMAVGPRWSELEEIRVYRSNELFNLRNPFA